MRKPPSEGGWGLPIVLLVLAIVAFLARDALTAYLGGVSRPAPSRGAQEPPRDAAPSGPSMPRSVERARGVEDTVARGAEARAKASEERGR